jgi:hypothetical protein
VWKTARDDLAERGKFYHEFSHGYFFFEAEKRLIPLDDRDQQLSCLLERYGLNPVEKTCEYVKEAMHIEALSRGQPSRVHRLCWYDRQSFTLYFYNHANQIYRITDESVELVDNGTDGVLFLSDPRNEPFELVPFEDLGDLFHQHVTSGINFDAGGRLSVADEQLLFEHWFLSIFFGSVQPTRTLLAFIGPKGSGKSFTLRRIGLLLYGPNFEVKNLPATEGDFDAIVTNAYYAAFDNADSKVRWLPDRLAVCATGGTVDKRVLYTTNTLVSYPINVFIGLTSRTPYFNRDDVADRLLVFHLCRFGDGQYRGEDELKTEVLRHRNRILTGVVRDLQECIASLRQTDGKTYTTSFRMADFATFCLRMAEGKGTTEAMGDLFNRMAGGQSAFTLEGDCFVELLLR